jgi:hypothetical protein
LLLCALAGAAELPPDLMRTAVAPGAPVVDRPLGQTTVNGVAVNVWLHGQQFAVGVAGAQNLLLATQPLDKMKPELAVPVQVLAQTPDAVQFVLGFAVESESGDTRWVAAWLRKNSATAHWTDCGEWTVERFDHKEQGERNERHGFEFIGENALRRAIVRNNIEGVQTTCPQGCCKIWQSKTMNTQELETFAVKAATGRAEIASIRRWYLAGPDDALFAIAAKVYGNVARFVTLQALNPELQKQEKLVEGQRVLYEAWPRN